MDPALLTSFRVEVCKLAASRVDKEIRAGRLGLHDFLPYHDLYEGADPADKTRALREHFRAPATVAPAQLARTRALNDRLHAAQIKAPNAEGYRVHNAMLPGVGAATVPKSRILGGHVFAPDTSGQFLRHATATSDPVAILKTTLPGGSKHLPPRQPQDSSLNLATLHHELGEAAEARRGAAGGNVNPFASHLGAEPIIRENIALRGDHEAQGTMAALRQKHPDDAYAQKVLRSVGATPGAPIPIGGKQHRAADRILQRSAKNLTMDSRQRAIQFQNQGLNIGYMPEHMKTIMSPRHVAAEVGGELKKKGLRGVLEGGLRGVADTVKRVGAGRLEQATKFLTHGV